MVKINGDPGIDTTQNVLYSLFVMPLISTVLITVYAFCAAAPIWFLFYLPCHLLIPRTSVLWSSTPTRTLEVARHAKTPKRQEASVAKAKPKASGKKAPEEELASERRRAGRAGQEVPSSWFGARGEAAAKSGSLRPIRKIRGSLLYPTLLPLDLGGSCALALRRSPV